MAVAALLAGSAMVHSPAAAACDFSTVKAAIDTVLDKDVTKAATFRKEFADGTDPFTILEAMVDAGMRAKIDECRFPAAEYLTKRGFPPSH